MRLRQGATIVFVYTGSSTNFDAFDSIAYAIDEKIANIISVSYGACELNISSRTQPPGSNRVAGRDAGTDDCGCVGRCRFNRLLS